MNTRWKNLGARLLVCGSLLGCITLLALYPRNTESPNPQPESVNAQGFTPNGYYTGPTRRISLDDTDSTSPPTAVASWRADAPVLNKKVTMHLDKSDVSSAVTMLAKMTGMNFVCMDPSGQSRLSLQMTDVPVWQVMQALAETSGGSWQHDHNVFTLRCRSASQTDTSS